MRQLFLGLLFLISSVGLSGQESGYSTIEHIYISGQRLFDFDVEEIALAAAYKYLPSSVNLKEEKLPKIDKVDPNYIYKLSHRAFLIYSIMSTDISEGASCSATYINVEIGIPAEFIHIKTGRTGTSTKPIFSKGVLLDNKSNTEIASYIRQFTEEAFIELAAKIEDYP